MGLTPPRLNNVKKNCTFLTRRLPLLFFLGGWTRYKLAGGPLLCPGPLLHVRPLHHDREVDGEVGPGRQRLLLLHLHRLAVLPRVLHTSSYSSYPRSWRCSHVVGQVHLSYPGGSQVTRQN